MTEADNCNRAIHPGAPMAGNCPHCVRAHAETAKELAAARSEMTAHERIVEGGRRGGRKSKCKPARWSWRFMPAFGSEPIPGLAGEAAE